MQFCLFAYTYFKNWLEHLLHEKALEDLNAEYFNFPKSSQQLFEEDLLNERVQCDNLLQDYRNNLNKLKKKWEEAEDQVYLLKEVIADQSNEQMELIQKLEDANKLWRETREELNATLEEQNYTATSSSEYYSNQPSQTKLFFKLICFCFLVTGCV